MLIALVKKYWILLVALLAVLVVIVISVNSKNDQEKILETIPTPIIPTITSIAIDSISKIGVGPNPSQSLEIEKREKDELIQNQKDYPLLGELPYNGTNFEIDHYLKPKQLVVYIKKGADKESIQLEINKWLKNNNFESDSHTIKWLEK
jgi:hypothetical protein